MELKRKFTNTFDISDYQVLTENGFVDVSQVHQTIPYTVYHIILEDEYELKCADDHILINSSYQQVLAKESLNQYIITETGYKKVIEVNCLGYDENMYDISIESDNHTYFSNGILSHNTTTASIILLHYAIFNDAKRIAILSNKESSSIDVLERIQMAYENLPTWMQRGVIEWNKKSVTFENKSKIIAAATSSDSIRGKACSMILIDEIAFISNFDEFYASTYPTISSGKTTKMIMISTPNGLNHFYDFWKNATEGFVAPDGTFQKSGFIPVSAPWYKMNGRDEKWKNETLSALNWNYEKFLQEYECVYGDSVVTISQDGKIINITLEELFNEIGLESFKILTPNGFESFHGIRRSLSKNNLKFYFDEKFIITTENHRFMNNGTEVIASTLKIGDVISGKVITNIEKDSNEIYVYDILETESNTYIADDIVHHNCEFMGSSTTLLSGATLKTLAKIPKNPIQRNDYINQYEQPVKHDDKPELNHIYVMICDVSKGRGMDYNTFSIFDITKIPYVQVCTYRCNTSTPTDFADVIVQMAKFYNYAYVLVEINVGDTVPRIVKYDHDYDNVLCMESRGRGGKQISSGFGKNIDLGIHTSAASKRLGCSMVKLLLEQNKIILYDLTTVKEFSTFQKVGISYEASAGFYDDMVMTVVLFAYITQDPYFIGLTDVNVMNLLRDKTSQEIEEELIPFGIINKSNDDEPKYIKFEGEKGLWTGSDEFKW